MIHATAVADLLHADSHDENNGHMSANFCSEGDKKEKKQQHKKFYNGGDDSVFQFTLMPIKRRFSSGP